jgi:hypothetical protein
MIPEEHKDDVVTAAVDFIAAVGRAYDSEVAISLWERIAEVIDPDIKGQVFMYMLNGHDNGQRQIRVQPGSFSSVTERISLIKFIREHDLSKPGLKEAKDMTDELLMGRTITLKVPGNLYGYIKNNLVTNWGLKV